MTTKLKFKTSGQRLKHIRLLLNFSQKKMAKEMNISQSTLSQIEHDHYTASIESLERLQNKHQLNCNWVISGKGHVFLIPNEEEEAAEVFEKEVPIKEKYKTPHNADDIPLIDKNAAAGYIKTQGSPEYLKSLNFYQIPGFEIAENHRIFQVEGDSMQPTFQSGDFLICEFCDEPSDLDSGDLVVVISDEGIFTKRIYIPEDDPTYFIFKSDNLEFRPFILKITDVMEVWEVKGRITTKLSVGVTVDDKKITRLEHDMELLKEQLSQLMKKQ